MRYDVDRKTRMQMTLVLLHLSLLLRLRSQPPKGDRPQGEPIARRSRSCSRPSNSRSESLQSTWAMTRATSSTC